MSFFYLSTLLNPDNFLTYFAYLGSLPVLEMLGRIFVDGGWLPALFVFAQGFWKLWVLSRNKKYGSTLSSVVLAINIPKDNEQTPKAVEQIFTQLSGAHAHFDFFQKYWLGKFQTKFSFEIVSIEGHVQFLVHCSTRFRDLIEAAIYAQYPDADIIEVGDYTSKMPLHYPDPEYNMVGTEFVLKAGAHLPLRTYPEFEHNLSDKALYFKDPMGPLLETMSSLKRGEQMWLQVLVSPTDESWKKSGEAEVNKMIGRVAPPTHPGLLQTLIFLPFKIIIKIVDSVLGLGQEPGAPPKKEEQQFKMLNMSPGERATLEAAQLKLAKIGLSTKIRWIYVGRRDVFNKARFAAVKGSLNQFSALNSNGLRVYGRMTPKDDYFWQRFSTNKIKNKLINQYKGRSGKGATAFVLNTEELATIYHFPFGLSKTPTVKKTEARRGEPPISLPMEEDPRQWPFEAVGEANLVASKPITEPKILEAAEEESENDSPQNLPLG